MRYYYKSKQGNGFLNLKTPLIGKDLESYEEITEAQFTEFSKPKIFEPTEEQKAAAEKARQISTYKKYLSDTDYIVLKIAEAVAESDSEAVEAIKAEYAEQLAKRKQAREKINELEK